MPDALPRTIDTILRGLEDGLHIGATLYVSLNGKLISHLVFAEAEPGRLLTHEASAPWLSAGKPQTAVAIAWLWERKLLKLDDPVSYYIPSFTGGGKEQITLRHCLTHTAGLRAAISAWTRQSEAEIIATLSAASIEPDWIPGQTAGYHVASTWYLLGKVVEEVTTRPLNTFLRDMIWKPLGMTGTTLTLTESEWDAIADNRLVMHDTSKSFRIRPPEELRPTGPRSPITDQDLERASATAAYSWSAPALDPTLPAPLPMTWETPETYTIPRPASGVRGPIADLGRFYEFMINVGDTSATAGPITHTTRAALTARHRVGLLDQTFKAKVDTGLGFICESSHYGQGPIPYQYGPHASPRTFGHGGNQSSVGMADPEHKLVVALLFNGMPGDPRHDKRMRETLGAIYEDLELV